MKRNHSTFRFNWCFSVINTLAFSLVFMIFLFSLTSCDTGSKGQYLFQSESMHWLQFRGPDMSGIAPEDVNPPVHFSADTNLLWKTEMLPGWSSPCIVNEKIFLTGFDDSDSLLYTLAVDREDGEVIWQDSVTLQKSYFIHPTTSQANPTIASDGKALFSHFPGYGLIAYDLEGNKAWEFTHEILSQSLYGGSSSPVLVDNKVIVLINSVEDPRIVALDKQTGESVWTFRAEEQTWASLMSNATPVVYNNLLIMHLFGAIVAVNMESGEPEWWLNTVTSAVGSPVIKDDVIYLNTWGQLGESRIRGEVLSFTELLERCDKNENRRVERDEIDEGMILFTRAENPDDLYSTFYYKGDLMFGMFDPNQDQVLEESEWSAMLEFIKPYIGDHGMLALPVEGSGERSVLEIKWKVNENTPETPSPLIVNENVFFIEDGGTLTIINRETGDVVHKNRIGAAGAYFSSPLLAGDKIYTCSYNGVVSILSAEDFSVLAQNKLKEKIGASPVAVDDVLYLRTDKHLYAFRE